jgi:hypothetical protein
MTDDHGGPLMNTTGVDTTTEVEEREYRAYAAVLGITPSAPSKPSDNGPRMVTLSTAEVERLRAMAAFKDTDPHDAEDHAYYMRHRSMILGVTS